MPYKVINRSKGPLTLPDKQRLKQYGDTKVYEITPAFKRLEEKGLISIHFLIEPPTENLSGWESLWDSDTNLGNSKLPAPLHNGMLLFGSGEKYMYNEGKWEHKGYASGKISLLQIEGVEKLTIDITGIDIVKFGQDVFDLSPTTGKAKLIARTLQELPPEEVMKHVYPTGEIFLKMEIVKGRDCKMIVYRKAESLLIDTIWPNHSMENYIELLRRHGIV